MAQADRGVSFAGKGDMDVSKAPTGTAPTPNTSKGGVVEFAGKGELDANKVQPTKSGQSQPTPGPGTVQFVGDGAKDVK